LFPKWDVSAFAVKNSELESTRPEKITISLSLTPVWRKPDELQTSTLSERIQKRVSAADQVEIFIKLGSRVCSEYAIRKVKRTEFCLDRFRSRSLQSNRDRSFAASQNEDTTATTSEGIRNAIRVLIAILAS
jgi:hypothetical protein